MKICVFVSQFHILNGAEKMAAELAVGLNQRDGCVADIVCMYRSDSSQVEAAEAKLKQQGVSGIYYLGLPLGATPLQLMGAIYRFRKHLLAFRYDAVEVSMTMPSLIASIAALGMKTPIVSGVHSIFSQQRHKTYKHKLWKLALWLNRNAEFYAVSHAAADAWKAFSGLGARRTRVIYNGIAPAFFSAKSNRAAFAASYHLDEGAYWVLFVSRLTAEKGVETLLDAVGPIAAQNNMQLIYVGDPDFNVAGTRQAVERMKGLVHEKQWQRHVHFIGRCETIASLMASADLLVHPSLHESFSLVVAEALAVGTPVIASNVGGIPEVVENAQVKLVPPDDAIRLREAVMEQMAQSEEQIEEQIRLGKQRAVRFTHQRRIDEMVDYFAFILSRPSRNNSAEEGGL